MQCLHCLAYRLSSIFQSPPQLPRLLCTLPCLGLYDWPGRLLRDILLHFGLPISLDEVTSNRKAIDGGVAAMELALASGTAFTAPVIEKHVTIFWPTSHPLLPVFVRSKDSGHLSNLITATTLTAFRYCSCQKLITFTPAEDVMVLCMDPTSGFAAFPWEIRDTIFS